jgi:hypothetical protein
MCRRWKKRKSKLVLPLMLGLYGNFLFTICPQFLKLQSFESTASHLSLDSSSRREPLQEVGCQTFRLRISR